ncbi:hypothetical protein BHE74_00054365 [Ensete ventricosum]|nr:hypothetical protein BHE74_00054365 [Ensete ventricosum]
MSSKPEVNENRRCFEVPTDDDDDDSERPRLERVLLLFICSMFLSSSSAARTIMGIVLSAAAADDSGARCKENEKAALLKLKQGLIDPSGRLSSWAGDDDCCRWRGVRCSNRTGHVVQLRLRNPSPSPDDDDDDFFLAGEISPSLLELKRLSYLDLSRNRFDGASIPGFIGSLTSLRYLNLSDAWFGGTIPHQLGNLSRLQYLDLHWLFIPPRRR